MSKKVGKIVIIIIVILAVILGILYLIDLNRMNNNETVLFSTWGRKYQEPKQTNNEIENNPLNNESYKKYSKTIENIELQLDIPNEWKYEEVQKDEENDFYKYALKLYKNNENEYAMIYFYYDKFGVCGTGRTAKNIVLNNGIEATIGYYDGDKNWSDISFYQTNEYIAVLNCGLVDNDAKEVIEFIKTINIIENNSKSCSLS